jgi:hypothetical protein
MDGVAGRRWDHRNHGAGNPRGAGANQTLAGRCAAHTPLKEAGVTELRLSVPEAGSPHPITLPFPLTRDLRLFRSAHRSGGSGWQPRGQGFESPWVHIRRVRGCWYGAGSRRASAAQEYGSTFRLRLSRVFRRACFGLSHPHGFLTFRRSDPSSDRLDARCSSDGSLSGVSSSVGIWISRGSKGCRHVAFTLPLRSSRSSCLRLETSSEQIRFPSASL